MVPIRNNNNTISLSPFKITLIYLIVAGLWIAFTDRLLNSFISDSHALSILQTYKGWFYVIITGLGLYWLIKQHDRQLLKQEEKREHLTRELRSEKKLRDMLFERIPILITIYDPDLETFEVNKEFEKVTGWTNKEISEQNIDLLKAVYPDLETRKEAVKFMNNPGVGWKEFSLTTRSGHQIPTSWTDIRLTDNTSVGIGIDMTDIKASQAKIRESRELLKKIIESLKSSLIVVDTTTRTIVDCNTATEEMFGYKTDELIGSSTRILHVDEDSYKQFDEMGTETLESNGVFQTEFRMQKKDGTVFYTDHTVTLVYDENNEVEKAVSIIRDITDQKRKEQELQKRQERLLRSQKIGQTGDWEFNVKTEEITWSPTMFEIFERDPELGTPSINELQSNYYGKSSTLHNRAVEQAIAKKEPYDIDLELITEKGNDKYIRAIGVPKANKDGEVTKLLGVVQDISERKKLEQELKKEKQRFELVALTTSDVIWDWDFVENTIWWSKGFEDHFGYDRDKLTDDPSSWTDHIHPEDKDRAIESLETAIKGDDKLWKEQYRFMMSDGSIAHIIDRGIIIREKNGKAVRMVGTLNNITERKKTEQKLRESEEKYRYIFEDNPQPMWIYDPETLKFEEVNQAAVNHYGYSEEEFLDMTLLDIRPVEDVEKLKATTEKHQSEQAYFGEWAHLKKDGTLINVEVSTTTVQYKNETVRLALIHDITEQKRMQEKIIQSVIEGEDRERKRIAHELHDGLGQFLVASTMNLQSVEPDIEDLSERRQKQFKTGLSLLKDALTETRSIAYNLMPKAIADYGLITALQNLIRDLQKSTDINFEFNCNCKNIRLKNKAETNIYRISQEAISNAVRHSECSNIYIRLKKTDNNLQLEIEDNGKGLKLNEKHEEQGLGLRSIKTRVNSLNGNIKMDSNPDEGMKISISIPNLDNLEINGGSDEQH